MHREGCREGSLLVIILEHQRHASHEECAEDGHTHASHRPCRVKHLLETTAVYHAFARVLLQQVYYLPIGPHMMADDL